MGERQELPSTLSAGICGARAADSPHRGRLLTHGSERYHIGTATLTLEYFGCRQHCRTCFREALKATQLPCGRARPAVAMQEYLERMFKLMRRVNLDENRATIRMRRLPPIDLSRRTARVVNVSLRQCADHSVAATALRIVPGHLEPVDQFAGAQTATEAAAILAALLFDRERRLRCAEHRRVRDSSPEVTSAWLARSPALASRVSCVIRRANGREPAGALSKCERASWARWSLDSQSCAGGPIRGQTYGTGRSSARLAQPPAAEDA